MDGKIVRDGVESLFRPLLLALAWLLFAGLSVALASPVEPGPTLIWPANALLTAALLLSPRQRHIPHIVAVALSSILLNLAIGRMSPYSIIFSAISIGEAVLAAWAIRRLGPPETLFATPNRTVAFGVIALLACLPSAMVAGLLLMLVRGIAWERTTFGWMTAHGCGMLVVVPLLLLGCEAWRQRHARPSFTRRKIADAAAIFALVAAVTTFVSIQSTYIVSFVIVPAILIATFRHRALGAAGSVVIIATIGSLFMVNGHGPWMLMPVPQAERVYVFELFTATMFLCSLPLAAVLDQRDRLAAKTTTQLATIRGIADQISDVLFVIDAEDRWSYLSSAYAGLTGRPLSKALGKPMLDELRDADRERIVVALERIRARKLHQFRFGCRVSDIEGGIHDVEVILYPSRMSDDRSAVAGVIRDVTARKRLDEELHRHAQAALVAARTDELTGLPNRRAFLERLDHLMASDRELILALFDVDHFKRINDGYGHPAGDEVLRRIAAMAAQQVNGRANVSRIGGEEFAILIEPGDGGAAEAIALAESVVTRVAAEPIPLSAELAGSNNDVALKVTISMGVARRSPDQDGEALVAHTDRALYAAKHGGRNQIRLAA